MDDLLLLINIVVFFSFGIVYFSKIENHFDYLKNINPNKYKDATSLMDATRRSIHIDIDELFILALPIFINRHKEIENKNIRLQALSKKIIKECYLIWSFVTFFILLNLIIHNLK